VLILCLFLFLIVGCGLQNENQPQTTTDKIIALENEKLDDFQSNLVGQAVGTSCGRNVGCGRGEICFQGTCQVGCATGCPNYWLGDSYCDYSCNNARCGYDHGDCEKEVLCNEGCPDNWIGDNICDSACNVDACQNDAGDCVKKCNWGGIDNNYPSSLCENGVEYACDVMEKKSPSGEFICSDNNGVWIPVKFAAKVYKIDPNLTSNMGLVTLSNLDESGYLKNIYVDVVTYCGSAIIGGCIAGPRVYSSNNEFIYENIEPGDENYFGSTDATGQGQQFDETMVYYGANLAVDYFKNQFNYIHPNQIKIVLFDTTNKCGGFGILEKNIFLCPPTKDKPNAMRDVKVIIHEMTHAFYHNFRKNIPSILDEGYAIYFASSIVNDSRYSKYLNEDYPKDLTNNYQYNVDCKDYPPQQCYKHFSVPAALWGVRKEVGQTILDPLIFDSWKIQPISNDPGMDAMISLIEASKQKYGPISSTHKKNKDIIIKEFNKHGIGKKEKLIITEQ